MKHPESRHLVGKLGVGLALGALAACTGKIDGASSPRRNLGGGPGQDPPALQNATFGRGVVHRLTRTEYDNTVHDLLGTDLRAADYFPPDVGADGFDNASGSQSLSASHVEAFEHGAEQLVEAWFANPALWPRVLGCDLLAGQSCIRQTLEGFVPKAWRRPVTSAEIDRLMVLAQDEASRGGDAQEQLKLVLRAVLTSSNFLFRIERDPDPLSPVPHRLSGHELASRLSYFLWSTMPDDTLFAAAADGTLQDDAVLGRQVERMLGDTRAKALVDVFAAQWFQLALLPKHDTDATLFPGVTPELKLAMAEETKLFFQEVLKTGGTIKALLTADYTFVNKSLAAHYKLPPPAGTGFEKVSVAGTNRIGGVLGHASILTHTSGANETSPVKRGAWVLTKILCTPPPPPPPGVITQLPDADPAAGLKTVRDRLAAHRADKFCAVCHDAIDPVGLGLEHYDPVGVYREKEGSEPIDASGQLPGGAKFTSAGELARLLGDEPELGSCVAEKLFTFALGRSPIAEDRTYVQALAPGNLVPVRDVLSKLAQSEPFRSRRGETEAEVKP